MDLIVVRVSSVICVRFVSLSMGLSACNSSGHLSNHADVAPNHAGITFAISNTLVSLICCSFKILFNLVFTDSSVMVIVLNC